MLDVIFSQFDIEQTFSEPNGGRQSCKKTSNANGKVTEETNARTKCKHCFVLHEKNAHILWFF